MKALEQFLAEFSLLLGTQLKNCNFDKALFFVQNIIQNRIKSTDIKSVETQPVILALLIFFLGIARE